MKILVTGANGYLGQGVVKELLDAGLLTREEFDKLKNEVINS